MYVPNIDLPVVPYDYVVIKGKDKTVAYGCKKGLIDFVEDNVEDAVNNAIGKLIEIGGGTIHLHNIDPIELKNVDPPENVTLTYNNKGDTYVAIGPDYIVTVRDGKYVALDASKMSVVKADEKFCRLMRWLIQKKDSVYIELTKGEYKVDLLDFVIFRYKGYIEVAGRKIDQNTVVIAYIPVDRNVTIIGRKAKIVAPENIFFSTSGLRTPVGIAEYSALFYCAAAKNIEQYKSQITVEIGDISIDTELYTVDLGDQFNNFMSGIPSDNINSLYSCIISGIFSEDDFEIEDSNGFVSTCSFFGADNSNLGSSILHIKNVKITTNPKISLGRASGQIAYNLCVKKLDINSVTIYQPNASEDSSSTLTFSWNLVADSADIKSLKYYTPYASKESMENVSKTGGFIELQSNESTVSESFINSLNVTAILSIPTSSEAATEATITRAVIESSIIGSCSIQANNVTVISSSIQNFSVMSYWTLYRGSVVAVASVLDSISLNGLITELGPPIARLLACKVNKVLNLQGFKIYARNCEGINTEIIENNVEIEQNLTVDKDVTIKGTLAPAVISLPIKEKEVTVTIPLTGGEIPVAVEASDVGLSKVSLLLGVEIVNANPDVADIYYPKSGINTSSTGVGITLAAGTGTTLTAKILMLGS